MGKYANERDGQIDFYDTFLPRINPDLTTDDIISDYNDGILNGNLLEFKLVVEDLNGVLFQAIKYLSARRIKGKPVPANIIIISLNTATAWHYRSEDYLGYIEKTYYGAASKNNKGFPGGSANGTYKYKNHAQAEALIRILKQNEFTKIHIDENCVVGWARSFYELNARFRKEDFIGDGTGKHKKIGELRRPAQFRDYIYPYTETTNVKFNYLMDQLNDGLLKKDLGSYYTPGLYAAKAAELVRRAISRVPEGHDYVIIDRCAGTGNLEAALTDEELAHCIVSTLEYYEYKVLQELFGAKVRTIIPPYEEEGTFSGTGMVKGADALSREYIEDPVFRECIDDPLCTIILFENPPYTEPTSVEHQRGKEGKKSAKWKESYAVKEMKEDIKGEAKATAANDMGNAFIWSAFRYFLRQPTDSYVVFSPVKYWKAQNLVNKEFLGGFAFNRKHFHTKIDACVMCALWTNVDDKDTDEIFLEGYDIKDGALSLYPEALPVRKIKSTYSEVYYDKRKMEDDIRDGILLAHDGMEAKASVKKKMDPVYNSNIIGYMAVDSSGFDNPDFHSCLLSAGLYNGNGFYLRRDNYLEKLPMFAASRYIRYNPGWTERARIMKSGDGATLFREDVKEGKLSRFLLKCLLFTSLERQPHMRTFTGSDGRFYRNELCLDDTNGATVASLDLQGLEMDEQEDALVKQWGTALSEVKKCANYNPALTYGVYQIETELDTKTVDEETGESVWDYVELHSALESLKKQLKEYYNTEIVPILFHYEFLK